MIVLTGRGADADRVRGLDFGADDYVVKPFHYPELRARIGAVLRRGGRAAQRPCRVGEIVVDPVRRKVTVGEREVQLANKEFSLLRVLASDPTRVFSKEELLREVWGYRTWPHPHPGLPRQPAAAQTRPRARPLRRQLLGRRLQVGRRMTGARRSSSPAGRWPPRWRSAVTAQGLRAGRRRSALNEALHELRRPLQAIALAVLGPRVGAPPVSRARCELAAAALERLDREINGGAGCRGPRRR